MLNLGEKGQIHYLWNNFAYIVAYLRVSGIPLKFWWKRIASEGFKEEQRSKQGQETQWSWVEGSMPVHTSQARPCCKDQQSSNVARCDRAMWHDRATLVSFATKRQIGMEGGWIVFGYGRSFQRRTILGGFRQLNSLFSKTKNCKHWIEVGIWYALCNCSWNQLKYVLSLSLFRVLN